MGIFVKERALGLTFVLAYLAVVLFDIVRIMALSPSSKTDNIHYNLL